MKTQRKQQKREGKPTEVPEDDPAKVKNIIKLYKLIISEVESSVSGNLVVEHQSMNREILW